MKTATKKLRSPVKWHGGKSYLARRIAALFPPHNHYVEPFAGGLSILLNKQRTGGAELANDLNRGLWQMWITLRNHGGEVAGMLSATPYCEGAFDSSADFLDSPDPIQQARAFIIRNRMSRGGLGKDFAWSDRLRGKRRPGGPVPGELNSWDTFVHDDLPRVIRRIQVVHFCIEPATGIIKDVDRPDTLFYCDPPYLHETRTHRTAYAHEMSGDDHQALLETLLSCRGKVFLSGYRSTLYDEALHGWTRHEFDMPNHSGQGKSKQRRVECVWEKPA